MKTVKEKLQRLGSFLGAMMMPQIRVFMAWGLMTAMFQEGGWAPNPTLYDVSRLVGRWALPLMIAAQGGSLTGGTGGRVTAVLATAGCISGSHQPMLLGAMILSPLAGALSRWLEKSTAGKLPGSLEMLIKNLLGLVLGLAMGLAGFFFAGPLLEKLLSWLVAAVVFLMEREFLPLTALLIEPAKVLYLNNTLNHGILAPLAACQTGAQGQSVLYMLEANPGPGLGLLLAAWFFSRDARQRRTARGAAWTQLAGGIHEVYFPYVLRQPGLLLAPILGNAAGTAIFCRMGCGLSGPVSPGSIATWVLMSPRGSLLPGLVGVLLSAGVSFLVAIPFLRWGQVRQEPGSARILDERPIRKVVFACDGGMGSSAMGAARFRSRMGNLRPDVEIIHASVDRIPQDGDLVVCAPQLENRARTSAPAAQLLLLTNFLEDPNLDALCSTLTRERKELEEAPPKQDPAGILTREGIRLGLPAVDRDDAIRQAGQLLEHLGCVEAGYADTMVQRENLMSTCMGMGIAIPHGTGDARKLVKKTGVVVLQYPDGVDFQGEKVFLIFGIAGVGSEHLELLGKICQVLEHEKVLETMKLARDEDYFLQKLQ